MAAPTITPRQLPTGFKMPEGFRALITFSGFPAIAFWEKSVKPPGWDGGEKIDTTTQHNVQYRTAAPRHLVSTTDGSVEAAYDPDALPTILSMINRECSVTYSYPDGSREAIYGFLQSFEQQGLQEGQFPMAQLKVAHTNYDYVNKVEAGPLFSPSTGT